MWKLCAAMGAVLAVSAGAANAEEATALQTAEACIRANAPEVAREDRSLESAAGFLVNYLCAAQVETASRWARNSEMLSVLTRASPQAASKIRVDPADGRLLVTPEPGKSPTDGLGGLNVLQSAFAPAVAPSLKALAARLVLEARAHTDGTRGGRRSKD